MLNKAIILLFISGIVFAHEGRHHAPHAAENKKPEKSKGKEIFTQVNARYELNVKPIFKNKCMNCHSSSTVYPFYYKIPGIKQLIDDDIAESKEHINMDKGFPFGGHGTPQEDLEALKKVIEENSMPPLRYKLMHWGSSLSNEEKNKILKWVNKSLVKIKAISKE